MYWRFGSQEQWFVIPPQKSSRKARHQGCDHSSPQTRVPQDPLWKGRKDWGRDGRGRSIRVRMILIHNILWSKIIYYEGIKIKVLIVVPISLISCVALTPSSGFEELTIFFVPAFSPFLFSEGLDNLTDALFHELLSLNFWNFWKIWF